MAGYDFAGARAAGISDDEILTAIEQRGGFKYDFAGARKAGLGSSEIIDALASRPKPRTGFLQAVGKGAFGDVGQGIGKTVKHFVSEDAGKAIEDTSKGLGPSNYESAYEGLMNPKPEDTKFLGYGIGYIPRAVAEMAPGFATDFAVARAAAVPSAAAGAVFGPGGAAVGGLLGGTAAGFTSAFLRNLGRESEGRAEARTGERGAVPTAEDKTYAAGSTALQAALNQAALGRFIKPSNLTGVGVQGAVEGLGKAAGKSAVEAGTEAAQEGISQVGQTINTPGGTQIDPRAMGAAGLVGGATGGAFAAPRAVKDATTSAKLSKFGGDDKASLARVANRLQAQSVDLKNVKESYTAIDAVKEDIRQELRDAVPKAYREDLSPETSNAIQRAKKGKFVTPDELAAVDKELPQDAHGDLVRALVQDANVLTKLRGSGITDKKRESFKGGLGAYTDRMFSPGSLALGGLGAVLGGGYTAAGVAGLDYMNQLAAIAPSIATGFGISTGLRYGLTGLDKKLGLRSPAATFAERFGDPTQGVRPTAAPQAAPVAPAAPNAAPNYSALLAAALAAQAPQSAAASQAPPAAQVAPNPGASQQQQAKVQEAPVHKDLKYTEINDQDRAEVKDHVESFSTANPQPHRIQNYQASALRRQARIRDRLLEASGDPNFPSDDVDVGEALDNLRRVRSREALNAFMDDMVNTRPDLEAVLRRYFGPEWAKSVWNPTK